MTAQDFRHEPAKVEISPPNQYSRAGARVDHSAAPGHPARARFLAGQPGAGDPPAPAPATRATTAPGERLPAAPEERRRYGNGQYAPNPLAERAERIHDLAHDSLDAARTRLDRLAAAVDYVRSTAKAASRAGMTHAPTEIAIDRVTDDLMGVGDHHADAMKAWSPS